MKSSARLIPATLKSHTIAPIPSRAKAEKKALRSPSNQRVFVPIPAPIAIGHVLCCHVAWGPSAKLRPWFAGGAWSVRSRRARSKAWNTPRAGFLWDLQERADPGQSILGGWVATRVFLYGSRAKRKPGGGAAAGGPADAPPRISPTGPIIPSGHGDLQRRQSHVPGDRPWYE